MKGRDLNDVIVVLGAASIAYALYTNHKMKSICAKLDKSIDEVASNIKVDISDVIIDSAVEKAVEKEAGVAVKRATDKAVRDIEGDISKEVKLAVREHYSDLKEDVAKEMRKKVGEIDVTEIKEEVVEKAKNQLAEKFDGSLDGLLDKFNGDLDNVSKIYRSIAKSITNNESDRGMTFRIG